MSAAAIHARIALLLADKSITFEEIADRVGRSPMIVRQVARATGQSRSMSHPVQRQAKAWTPRRCMACSATVKSEHAGHRMCGRCRIAVPDRDTPYAL